MSGVHRVATGGVHRASRLAGVLSVLDILRTPNGLRMVAAGAAVLTVVAASWGGYKLVSQPSCADQIRLSIVAAPEIEPAVRATTQEWTAAEPRIRHLATAPAAPR